ncbi:pro-adrenomedullin-like [Rana temporaria]|uniref:pro-adrenomedullin-like n=1 Tax=Rana temporaria TaxID=8407 RepID=UPI001AACB4FD|nr:pro-adrenomedullin-like [Rana temporaria]
MARRECLALFFLVMTFSVCNSLWMDHKVRHMPPPVESFLEKLGGPSKQRLVRDERNVDNSAMEKSEDNSNAENFQDNNQNTPSYHREKRYAPSVNGRGCHLGTCQIQNLANMLYRLGKNNYKDGSNKDTKDPLGYGRRRRRSFFYSKDRTDSTKILQTT